MYALKDTWGTLRHISHTPEELRGKLPTGGIVSSKIVKVNVEELTE